jgi:hypothetical protein
MRTFIFVLTALISLSGAFAVSASTLSVTTDSAVYNVGDTNTVTVVGSAPGDLFGGEKDLIISGNLGWDASLVSHTGSIVSGPFPLTGGEAFGNYWTAGGINGTCGGLLGDNCKVFDYNNGFTGPGHSINNSPLLMATMTFTADAVGIASFDWTALDFYDQQGAQGGISVVIVAPRPDLQFDLVDIELFSTGISPNPVDTVFVGNGIPEITCPNGFALCSVYVPGTTLGWFDVESHSLTLEVGMDGTPFTFPMESFIGYIFSDLDGGTPIIEVELETTITGLDGSRIEFVADAVAVNMSGLTVDSGEYFTVHLPEPSQWLQLGVGWGLLVAFGWRRRRRPAG